MRRYFSFLFSVDFRPDKGGISRVANIINYSVPFSFVYSFYGKDDGTSIKFFNGRKFLFTLSSVFQLFVKRPQLVVFDHLGVASILAFVPSFMLQKVVIFLHDEEAWKPITGRHRLALKKATHLVTNSEYTLRIFLRHNSDFSSKTKACLPAGVPANFDKDEHLRKPHHDVFISNPAPYCIFVSRLWKIHRYKGYVELVEAYALAIKKEPSFSLRLAIIGRGDDREYLIELVASLHLQDFITVFDDVSDDDLQVFYRNALALTFPSSREGFGMVFLEAMFMRKACIGLRNQPAEEIIVNGTTGVLLEDNDPQTISRVLLDLYKNPRRFIEMGEKGRDLYNERFTIEEFKTRFLKVIEEA